MKPQKRLYPEFNFPLPRFEDQYNHAVKVALVAEKMKNFGTRVDTGRALAHALDADKRAAMFGVMFQELTALPHEALGPSGAGTTKAVKEWFRAAGAPDVVWHKVSKKPQFNAAALTCWASDYADREFAKPAAALLGLRKAVVAARFARAYYEVATQHGSRIHFDFNTIGTKGHRWSASAKFRWTDSLGFLQEYSLNAQNVPKKKVKYDFGPGYGVLLLATALRDCFVPDPGNVWATFDYEGAEAVLIAYNTGDELLLKWLTEGADIHTENAKIMFPEMKIPADLRKIPDGSPFAPYRAAAKPAQYALSYQAPSASGEDKFPELMKQWKAMFPHMTDIESKVAIDRFFAAHKGIRGWQHGMAVKVAEDGYVTLPQTGRTIYVSNTAKGKNMALNYFMQSGIGALIDRAIPIVAGRCTWALDGPSLLLQVHDELDFQIPEGQVDEFCGFVEEEMSKPADFGGHFAGVKAEADIGPSWGETASLRKLRAAA